MLTQNQAREYKQGIKKIFGKENGVFLGEYIRCVSCDNHKHEN